METTFNGRTVPIRQITVKEITAMLDTRQPPTMAELLLDRDTPEWVVRASTGLSTEELNGDVMPSELAALWDAVEAANPLFCRLHRRLIEAGKELVGLASPLQKSEDAPAPLPASTDTPG